MNSNKILAFSALLVFLQIGCVFSECKIPTTKPDFDVTKYLGFWYNLYGKVSSQQQGSKCTRAEYTDMGDGKVRVHNDGTFDNGTISEICGFATVPDPNEPGLLLVNFPTTPSPPAPYYVLDTDYENWASVFSCSEARPEGSSYILARRIDLEYELVAQAFVPFLLNDIDISEFYEFPHPDCTYTPEFPDPSCQ